MSRTNLVCALAIPGFAVLSVTGCSSSGGGRVYYQGYYGASPWRHHYYRPGYVGRPIPDFPERPVAAPLPEPPVGGMPDIGMPDIGGGLEAMPPGL